MARLSIGAISLFSVLITACSVTYDYAVERYRNAEPCCRNFSEFDYKALSNESPYIADINENSPFFRFATGNSYFIGLVLPPFKRAYQIAVASFALGEQIDKGHIFSPEVLLLDGGYSVIGKIEQSAFKISKSSYDEAIKENKWGLPVKLEGSFAVENPNIKYIVIYTTGQLLSTSSPYRVVRTSPVILPNIVTTIPLYEEEIQIPHSPFGRIVVRILNEP